LHPVSETRLGDDVQGSFGVGLDLLAQLANVNADVLHVAVAAPQFFQDELMGQDPPGMLDQKTQQVVFMRPQLHANAAYCDDAADEVDSQVTAAKDWRLAVLLQPVAQRDTCARQELVNATRLREVSSAPRSSDLILLIPSLRPLSMMMGIVDPAALISRMISKPSILGRSRSNRRRSASGGAPRALPYRCPSW